MTSYHHLAESFALAEGFPPGPVRDALLEAVIHAGLLSVSDAIVAAQEGLAAGRDLEWPAALEAFARAGEAARELLEAPRVLALVATDTARRRQHEQ